MLIRLRAYHDYLEKLASRLSHELRTPVAVVRSSLENIQEQIGSESDNGIEGNLSRAEQGVKRLQTLLQRMAEASRLEQSIHESVKETVDLSSYLNQLISGYRSIYATHTFTFSHDVEHINASPELLAQALDKLINNAVSFATEDSEISIQVKTQGKEASITVENNGPHLPDGMETQLFQSMVSVREKDSQDEQPHLGLGLHIVQLIAEYHSGQPFAENTAHGVRIGFTVKT